MNEISIIDLVDLEVVLTGAVSTREDKCPARSPGGVEVE